MRTVDELKEVYLDTIKEVLESTDVTMTINAIINKSEAPVNDLAASCSKILKDRMTEEEYKELSPYVIDMMRDVTKIIVNHLVTNIQN